MKFRRRKAKSILVIGLGRFGKHLAMSFCRFGNDVMALDIDEKIVQSVSSIIEDVVVGDCTDENVISSLGVADFDMCFVTIGKNLESSLVITSHLKSLGAKYIVAKAGRSVQVDILKKIGADDVVYPEHEMAEKLALRYNTSNILDYMELNSDLAIFEIEVPLHWVGKSIVELHIRRNHHINILAVRSGDSVFTMPSSDYEFSASDQIIIGGNPKDIEKLTTQ